MESLPEYEGQGSAIVSVASSMARRKVGHFLFCTEQERHQGVLYLTDPCQKQEVDMRGILLWLIGIPIPIIILLFLFGVF